MNGLLYPDKDKKMTSVPQRSYFAHGERAVLDLFMINPSDAEVSFVQCIKKAKHYENHLNPVMLVFIGKLSLSTLR